MRGHPKVDTSSIIPAGTGANAVARLLGTLVTLADTARSSGATIAITYDCRAGTSICDSEDRKSRNTIVSVAFGISPARISRAFEGRCVYTIVLILPIRATSADDANCDAEPRRLAAKKNMPAASTDTLKRRNNHSAIND